MQPEVKKLIDNAEERMRRYFKSGHARDLAEGQAFARFGAGLRPSEFASLFEKVGADLEKEGVVELADCKFVGRFKIVPKVQ